MNKKTMMKVHSALQNDHDQGVRDVFMFFLTIYFWLIVICGFAALIVLAIIFPDMAFTAEYFYCKSQGICG